MAAISAVSVRDDIAKSSGLILSVAWVQECIDAFKSYRGANRDAKNFVFQQALWNDLKVAAESSIPQIERGIIQGPFVVQVEETLNISHHFEDRDNSRGVNKLLFSDGNRFVHGFEYRKINGLDKCVGLKCMIQNVKVERGLLCLTPDNLVILGGGVPIEDNILPPPPAPAPVIGEQQQHSSQTISATPQPSRNFHHTYPPSRTLNNYIAGTSTEVQPPPIQRQVHHQLSLAHVPPPPTLPSNKRPSSGPPLQQQFEEKGFVEASISDEENTM
jgi:hypothetical protein